MATCDATGATLAPRRARHPLHTAFRTVDAADYCEIATVEADRRAVLDLALDVGAGLAVIITVDASDGHASSARVYEIGRGRAQVRACSRSCRAGLKMLNVQMFVFVKPQSNAACLQEASVQHKCVRSSGRTLRSTAARMNVRHCAC